MRSLLVAFTAFWRVLCICRRLYVRADVRHREALVFFAGTGGTFPEILLALVQSEFLSAINAHIFARADFLSCVVRLLFGHTLSPKVSCTSKIYMGCVSITSSSSLFP